jgi:hypothetical protein
MFDLFSFQGYYSAIVKKNREDISSLRLAADSSFLRTYKLAVF